MQELTTFVTSILGGATGEGDAMMTEVPEEHRHILTTLRAQAEDYARTQYKEMQAEVGLFAEQPGQQSECTTTNRTTSSVVEAAATTLETLRGLQSQPTLPDEGEDGTSIVEMATHAGQHKDDVTYVTKYWEEIREEKDNIKMGKGSQVRNQRESNGSNLC